MLGSRTNAVAKLAVAVAVVVRLHDHRLSAREATLKNNDDAAGLQAAGTQQGAAGAVQGGTVTRGPMLQKG